MPDKMDELFDLESGENRDLPEREERCQKAMKTVSRAIFMRLVICGLLIWIVFRSDLQLWSVGLMLLVLLINVSGMIPLIVELKKRRAEWKALLEEEN